jgi:hypothetical protein
MPNEFRRERRRMLTSALFQQYDHLPELQILLSRQGVGNVHEAVWR